MSDKSAIEWTDASWNPVTGCDDVSPGCEHCYARTFAERWRGVEGHYFRRGFDVQLRPEKLDQPLRWARPRRIFVNSMSDLFHGDVPDEYIAAVFVVMAEASRHTFQVLTKRHARMRSLLSSDEFQLLCFAAATARGLDLEGTPWPLPNVHLGVSAEDQRWADIRIPALLQTPAAVRFVSAEPLLGPIDLAGKLGEGCEATGPAVTHHGHSYPVDYGTGVEHDCEHEIGIDWLIIGGESGAPHRTMDMEWLRSLAAQAVHDVPVFVKQDSGRWSGRQGRIPDDLWALKEFPRAVEAVAL